MTSTTHTVDFNAAMRIRGSKPWPIEVPDSNPEQVPDPAIARSYHFAPWTKPLLMWFRGQTDGVLRPLWVTGPTGCGKSQAIVALCSAVGMPLFQFTGSSRTEVTDFLGRWNLKGTQTVWMDGPLTTAVRNGGVFLLDEADTLDPSILVMLNGVLDGRILSISENGETVRINPHFMFVATANSCGDGTSASKYNGTLAMNTAFVNRFSMVEADYMDPGQESNMLTRLFPQWTGFVPNLVRFANMVRELSKGNAVSGLSDIDVAMDVAVSVRTLRSILWWMTQGLTKDEALDVALANQKGGDPAVRKALHEIMQRVEPNEPAPQKTVSKKR